jgi:uncharacterized protein YcnI
MKTTPQATTLKRTTLKRTTLTRLGLTAATTAVLMFALPAAASAHVTVRPDVDTAGSWAKLTFRVPNESDTAGTVELRVEIPTEAPFRSVRVQPHPGWTAEVTRDALPEPVEVGDFVLDEAVTAITWTADDGVAIGPDEFDEFAISVGPLPEPGDYPLPSVQIYDDGEAVAWADEPDADYPAPVLTVVDGGDDEDDGHGHGGSDEQAADAVGDHAASDTGSNSDGVARGLAIGGLAVGAIGLGVGGTLLRRSRA